MTDYETAVERGAAWTLYLDDACERLPQLDAESVDLSVHSPPFDSLYVYSDSLRDLGNSKSRDEFLTHYGFVIRELFRLTKPGRMACVHVMDLSTTKATHGVVGLTDFSGQVISAYVAEGWTYVARITVRKNPQAAAQRTKAQGLMFTTLRRDSSKTRPVHPDYVLIFRKPGDNTVPIATDVDNDTWIQWAEAIWTGIRETDTLNVRVAREDADERHIAPLQLSLIERCVRLWSNVGELVLSPFAGIGSEGYEAVRLGRRFVGVELKPSYFKTAVGNLREAEASTDAPGLFDELTDDGAA
ncbi:MAG: DNA-methyltransferase [Micromonosporaceae bacterium]